MKSPSMRLRLMRPFQTWGQLYLKGVGHTTLLNLEEECRWTGRSVSLVGPGGSNDRSVKVVLEGSDCRNIFRIQGNSRP